MQGLVYLFIALSGAGLGTATYFMLAFTPIEAALLALIVFIGGVLILERTLRHRAEAKLQKAVSEMTKLLSTDAQAGQVLSKRVNALIDLDLGARMDVIEADMSVLGTVVRQVAEAVSELETAQAASANFASKNGQVDKPVRRASPTVPLTVVEAALDNGRLIHHVRPILTLPQRRLHAYELYPRLQLEGGRLADPPEYMPVGIEGGATVIRRIERICTEEAIRLVRRARLLGEAIKVHVPLAPSSLANRAYFDQLMALLAANRAINPDLFFALDYADWTTLDKTESDRLALLVEEGAGLAVREADTLRLDFAALAGKGVRYLSVDAGQFIDRPSALTDFHSADINDYIRRFGINLVAAGTRSEQQILSLLDDEVKLAQGNALAEPGPVRSDLAEDGDDDLQTAAGR
ncbi:EAL domain-containing protein [Pelagibacterium halotolerans]|uniref:EAL domain-containing protein n=1 Tax=Pelagibacterium halotolerans TaxID=531813 RepID=UPI00384E33D3